MRGPSTFFEEISVRRRVIITVGIVTVLTVVIGIFGLIAVLETNKRLHQSVLEGQAMIRTVDAARLAQVHYKRQVQEWKNILLRGNDRQLYERHLRAFDDEDRRVKAHLQALSEMAAAAGVSVPEIEEAVRVHDRLGVRYREALKDYRRSDLKSAVLVDQRVRGLDREPTRQIDAIVAEIERQAGLRLAATETVAKTQLHIYQSLSVFLIFLVVLGVCFGISNARSIVRDLPPDETGVEAGDGKR
jgi:methyl-accepting chemotaxis protein